MILDKDDKLTDLEWEAMRRHTAFTYRILQRVNGFSQIADLASAHHERPDGGGYHRAVSGGELSASARMLAVADQYEALTATRPYRAALLPEQALQILGDQVGTGIDEQAYEALRAMLGPSDKKPPTN
jgi:HD-GYP domain-containing protein (c-di-GMP phosphodiesterase class II)